MNEKKLVYLAIPYSHPDESVRNFRFETANRIASELMRAGLFIYSPISHSHPIALAGGLPLGWDFWEKYDRAILESCWKIIVVQVDGWDKSSGVSEEIKIAKELGLCVEFIKP